MPWIYPIVVQPCFNHDTWSHLQARRLFDRLRCYQETIQIDRGRPFDTATEVNSCLCCSFLHILGVERVGEVDLSLLPQVVVLLYVEQLVCDMIVTSNAS